MKRSVKIFVIVGITILGAFLLRGRIPHDSFDSEKWKKSDFHLEENWALRWDMMNSLRNNYTLIGMTKDEIIKLLGNPDSSFQNTMIYSLGYTHTGINTGTLTLTLNKKGVVTKIRVWQG